MNNNLVDNDFLSEDMKKALKILTEEYGYKLEDLDICNGVMGVPITFMSKYNQDQYDIVGLARPKIDGVDKYARVLIRRK